MFVDLDDYGKPLPPPPVGFYWSRLEDGSWEILEYEKMKSSDDNDFVTFDSSSVIEHVVMPSDTLQGDYLSVFYHFQAFSCLLSLV